ncbi:tetratricopeptide repeat protein [Paraburkholderia mimosarum]|uniref:tetratricopeptide repeat protein n=1 Tax=Paraburkholderia mimosarum TaxID=312026 RepID=UPI00041673DB|nr:tetratricopeptide repeat protein [Paraburkholderia mimosarum]
MKVRQILLLATWMASASAVANLIRPIDISDEFLRYRHNSQAIAVFGTDISNDPVLPAAARSGLYFQNGRRAFKAKRYLDSIQEYSRCLDIHRTAPAFNNRGLAYWKAGNVDAAAQDFSDAIQLDPNDVPARLNRGNLMLGSKRFDVAIEDLTHAIDSGDRRVDIYIARGNAYRLNGDAASALHDYDTVLALAPTSPQGHVGKGGVFDDLGMLFEAKSEFTTALELAPSDTDATLALAMVLHKQRRYSESIVAFTSALKSRPTEAWIFEQRAHTYSDMGNWTQAISDYSNAIVLDPQNDMLHRLRGIAYDHQGDYSDAIADFTESIRLAPTSARGYVLRARTLVHSGNVQRSVDDLSQVIKLMPDVISLRQERAISLEQLGDYASAIVDYRLILQADPNDTNTRCYLADDETTLGQYDDAAHDYEIVSHSAPFDDGLLYGRAQLNFYTGDFRRADADLAKWQDLYRRGKIQKGDGQPYYVDIWRHIIALKLSAEHGAELDEQVGNLDSSRWPYPVLALYTGRSTVTALLSAADRSEKERRNRMCETNAYLGEWLLAHDDQAGARRNFEAASMECPANFIEKTLARRELQRMSQSSAHVAVQNSTNAVGLQFTTEERRRPPLKDSN